jgi:hypothetical protein
VSKNDIDFSGFSHALFWRSSHGCEKGSAFFAFSRSYPLCFYVAELGMSRMDTAKGTDNRFDRLGEILRHLLPVHVENALFFSYWTQVQYGGFDYFATKGKSFRD